MLTVDNANSPTFHIAMESWRNAGLVDIDVVADNILSIECHARFPSYRW